MRLSRADILTGLLVAPLMALMIATFIHVSREKYPIYPMPLHPGTQVISHEMSEGKEYKFRFINNHRPIWYSVALANTDCKRAVVLGNSPPDDPRYVVRYVAPMFKADLCAQVAADDFPMVFECWPAPANAGSYNSCQGWN